MSRNAKRIFDKLLKDLASVSEHQLMKKDHEASKPT
jgi:hypothetical protein